MQKEKKTKSLTNIVSLYLRKLLIATGIAVCASSVYPSLAEARSLTQTDRLLISQNLGGIIREISMEEIPIPVMTSAQTATAADFTSARTELKSDGSLVYFIRGKNQQGFEVEVQALPNATIIQVDEQIDPSAVPETVFKAFQTWVPNAQPISTWRSTRLGELVYQFVIPDFWLEVTDDTKKVTIYRRVF